MTLTKARCGHLAGARYDDLSPAAINAARRGVLDYDDTHMGGVLLHTSSPVLAALFSLAEHTPVSGKDFMLAYAVGFEAGVRTGRTAPGHHDGGWHLTGTLGTIAAGVAAGKLLKLDRQRLTYAMGIAATQSAGMQQNRGTMCKSFHAGKAASNGVYSANINAAPTSAVPVVDQAREGANEYSWCNPPSTAFERTAAPSPSR